MQYFYTEDIDDDSFSIHRLEIHMVIDQYSDTEDVDDDVLMKPLPQVEFKHFQNKLGVVRKGLPRKGE